MRTVINFALGAFQIIAAGYLTEFGHPQEGAIAAAFAAANIIAGFLAWGAQ